MSKWIIILVFCFCSFAWAQDGSLNANCKQNGFSCGECDTTLQNDFNALLADITGSAPGTDGHWGGDFNDKKAIKPGVTLESTLARIKEMMKGNNPNGDGGLNMIVIGNSESLQPSAVRDGKMYPRVALKSPNSELWVTFSTDPTNAAYQTLEVMRWNGKDSKYEFMELNFNQNERQVDGTGTKCLSCHKEPDPRPNWDTYRAWAGVVPSRDDMIEMHSKNGQNVRGEGEKVGADGRAYLSFLEQIVDAKEKKPNDRLALMDIPVDPAIQFEGRNPAITAMSPREQLEAIKQQVQTTGHYRIPHYPYKEKMKSANFDEKTAPFTGPSQAAFDQMSGQNFCRVSNRLKQNPQYEKFKYFLAGVAHDCVSYPEDMKSWVPEEMQQKIVDYYRSNPQTRLRDLSLNRRTPRDLTNFENVTRAVLSDTEQNHNSANQFKYVRHETFLNQYLTSVEGLPTDQAKAESTYFSREMQAPYLRNEGFHAIEDFGGVRGVDEAHPQQISALRAVLEPMGIDVNQWSMMRGSDPNYNSLAFSDQFALLFEQAAVTDVLEDVRKKVGSKRADVCAALRKKSYQGLTDVASVAADENQFDVVSWCRDRLAAGEVDTLNDSMKDALRVNRQMLVDESKKYFQICMGCHGKFGEVPFPGMDTIDPQANAELNEDVSLWTDGAWDTFNKALTGEDPAVAGFPLGPDIITKMQLHKMPPGGWKRGPTKEAQRAEDGRRRAFISDYVRLTMVTTSNEDKVRAYCQSIVTDSQDKTNPTNTAPAGVGGAKQE